MPKDIIRKDIYFHFDNYIEFGKFLEELLYNFSYNYLAAKKSVFTRYKTYSSKEYKIDYLSHFKFASGEIDIKDLYGDSIFNYPARELSTVAFINNGYKIITVIIEIKISAYYYANWRQGDASSRTNIYQTHKTGTKEKAIILSFNLSQVFDKTNNTSFYRTNKKSLTKTTMSGFCIHCAKTIFLI